MKTIIVNIGSNSIKILKMIDGVISKKAYTTRLEEGSQGGMITPEAIARSLEAIRGVDYSGYDNVFAFATEAVRSRSNGKDFAKMVSEIVGVEVEILSGEDEADIGYIGANRGRDVIVMDIGGASTEISYGFNKELRKSIPIGAVRMNDICGEDEGAIRDMLAGYTKGIKVPQDKTLVLIGGTSLTLAAVIADLKVYNKSLVDGKEITIDQIYNLCKRLAPMSIEERRCNPLIGKRAEVIVSGGLMLVEIMKTLDHTSAIVSDIDATEGYLMKKLGIKISQ